MYLRISACFLWYTQPLFPPGDLSGGRVRLMQKSRIQKPSTSRQCTLRIMDLHVRWMHPMHIGRTPILEKTTAAALHLISLIIRAALNCRGRVRLIGAFGGGCMAFDAFSARGRHASYFNNGFVLLPSAVGEMNRPAPVTSPSHPQTTLRSQHVTGLFTFRISTMKTRVRLHAITGNVFPLRIRVCVCFLCCCVHIIYTAGGERDAINCLQFQSVRNYHITPRLLNALFYRCVVIYEGHC